MIGVVIGTPLKLVLRILDEWQSPKRLHEYTALNEIHISRVAGNLTTLDLYVDEELATTVQADGK